jgi:hypothetical protein
MTTTPKRRFQLHCSNSKRRGIGFNLTFEEWWDIWQSSGFWHLRGNRKGQYVMSRYQDQGDYEVGNVFIQLFENNFREVSIRPKSSETKAKMSLAKKGKALTAEHKAAISAAKKAPRRVLS